MLSDGLGMSHTPILGPVVLLQDMEMSPRHLLRADEEVGRRCFP